MERGMFPATHPAITPAESALRPAQKPAVKPAKPATKPAVMSNKEAVKLSLKNLINYLRWKMKREDTPKVD